MIPDLPYGGWRPFPLSRTSRWKRWSAPSVDVPEAGLRLDWVIRRNLDQVLPASHLIELTFTTPNDPGRPSAEVGVLQFKIDEAGRGTPLAGLPVPVKENVFWSGCRTCRGTLKPTLILGRQEPPARG